MYCCSNCFKDEYLRSFIQKKRSYGDCDYCNSKQVKVVEVGKLKNAFEFVEKIYSCYEELEMEPSEYDEYENTIVSQIQKDWNVFSDLLNTETILKLYKDIMEIYENYYYVDYPRCEMVRTFIDFEDCLGLRYSDMEWNAFCAHLKHSRRYILDDSFVFYDAPKYLLTDEVLESISRVINKGDIFYRAREGYNKSGWKAISYEISELGPPPEEAAKAGRANPEGIVYLYVASTKKTAVSEIKPWKGAKVSVANIKISNNMKVIDFSKIPSYKSPFKYCLENKRRKMKPEYDSISFLKSLSQELSKPINPNKPSLEYIPTQYLVEFILSKGFDGLLFKSSVGEGDNLIIFDPSNAEVVSSKLVEVEGICISIKDI